MRATQDDNKTPEILRYIKYTIAHHKFCFVCETMKQFVLGDYGKLIFLGVRAPLELAHVKNNNNKKKKRKSF